MRHLAMTGIETGLHDLGDELGVGHAGHAAVARMSAGTRSSAITAHGAGVLGDPGLLGRDDVHDDAALEHLGEAALDARRCRGRSTSVPLSTLLAWSRALGASVSVAPTCEMVVSEPVPAWHPPAAVHRIASRVLEELTGIGREADAERAAADAGALVGTWEFMGWAPPGLHPRSEPPCGRRRRASRTRLHGDGPHGRGAHTRRGRPVSRRARPRGPWHRRPGRACRTPPSVTRRRSRGCRRRRPPPRPPSLPAARRRSSRRNGRGSSRGLRTCRGVGGRPRRRRRTHALRRRGPSSVPGPATQSSAPGAGTHGRQRRPQHVEALAGLVAADEEDDRAGHLRTRPPAASRRRNADVDPVRLDGRARTEGPVDERGGGVATAHFVSRRREIAAAEPGPQGLVPDQVVRRQRETCPRPGAAPSRSPRARRRTAAARARGRRRGLAPLDSARRATRGPSASGAVEPFTQAERTAERHHRHARVSEVDTVGGHDRGVDAQAEQRTPKREHVGLHAARRPERVRADERDLHEGPRDVPWLRVPALGAPEPPGPTASSAAGGATASGRAGSSLELVRDLLGQRPASGRPSSRSRAPSAPGAPPPGSARGRPRTRRRAPASRRSGSNRAGPAGSVSSRRRTRPRARSRSPGPRGGSRLPACSVLISFRHVRDRRGSDRETEPVLAEVDEPVVELRWVDALGDRGEARSWWCIHAAATSHWPRCGQREDDAAAVVGGRATCSHPSTLKMRSRSAPAWTTSLNVSTQ